MTPGMRDMLLLESPPVRDIVATVQCIAEGRVTDWHVLEDMLAGCHTFSLSEVQKSLSKDLVTAPVKHVFWDLARHSEDSQAVKWGLGLATLQLEPGEVADVRLLARHPEFTGIAAEALLRESGRMPHFKDGLIDLLPVTRGWGVVQLIQTIVRDGETCSRAGVARQLVLHGMENCDGLARELAFILARAMDLRPTCAKAVDDDRLFVALANLLDTLMLEPDPQRGLTKVAHAQHLLDSYVTMLRQRSTDIHSLHTLHVTVGFAESTPGYEAFGPGAAHILKERFAEDVIAAALLAGSEEQGKALTLVRDHRLHGFLPMIEARLDGPDVHTLLCLDILGRLGDSDVLSRLAGRIEKIVDVEARLQEPLSATNRHGPDKKATWQYAEIVRHLGRLRTPETLALLQNAARDPDPLVRDAFCQSLLQVTKPLPAELGTALRDRLDDPMPYVAASARRAAEWHGGEAEADD
jgi:hypothetical protein